MPEAHDDKAGGTGREWIESTDSHSAPQPTAAGGKPATATQVAALSYEHGVNHAPKLVAHGKGHAAEKILAIAQEFDIPMRKDPTLVAILGALDVGSEIPPDLYGVIAEVLAWAYRTDKLAGEGRGMRRAA